MLKPRTRLRVLLTLLMLGSISALWMYGGCNALTRVTGTFRPSEQRNQRLMALAAEEAGLIADVDARLTRQLNLAEQQINRGWKEDAVVTLTATRTTLASPDAAELTDHARLSGWVSASQLSREVKDLGGASVACQAAQADLLKIADPARRCQYVMGIANELQYINGKPAAARMLAQAGPWTKAIEDPAQRKQAVISFATALFNLDDFSAGQTMLRQEGDAGWRSDMLAQLAMTPAEPAVASAQVAESAAVSADMAKSSVSPNAYYGKSLDYRQVFQNQTKSNTKAD